MTQNISTLAVMVGLVLLVAPWVNQWTLRSKVVKMTESIDKLKREQVTLSQRIKQTKDALQKKENESKSIEQENTALIRELTKHGDNVNTNSDSYSSAKKLEDIYVLRIDELENEIKRSSLQSLKMKGKDQYRVKFILHYDTTSERKTKSFVLETAPIGHAAHAVDFFIRTVDAKLWDGLTFIRPQGVASDVFHTTSILAVTRTWDEARFHAANLTQLAFTEQADSLPKSKYSAVFSGRGPHFYIIMDEHFNTDEVDEAESCFGRVVEGQDLLEKIFYQQRSAAGYSMITIVSAERIE